MRALVVILALSGAMGAAGAAEMTGRLLNGSVPDGVVADFEVKLTARLASGERLEQEGRTDEVGRYHFASVPGDTADVYVLSTNFQGVEYASRLINYALGETQLESDLLVYEVTDDVSNLVVAGHHYVLEVPASGPEVLVTEVVAITNRSLRTFLSHSPLHFPLPEGVQDVQPLDGFENAFFSEGALHLTTPMRPGTDAGSFRYKLPRKDPFVFTVEQNLVTEEATLLVAPVGARVEGANLTQMETTDLGGGVICDRYAFPTPPVGTPVTFTVHLGPGGTPARLAWILTGIMLAVSAGVILLRERSVAPEGRPAKASKTLIAERDRHLSEVLALERAQLNGGLPEEEFQRRRDQLVAKATAVQELLDHAVGRDS